MNCLCKKSDYRIVYRLGTLKDTQIVECLSCGLYRTTPPPSLGGKLGIRDYAGIAGRERERVCRRHKEIINLIKRRITATSQINLLDIGCSMGYFVKDSRDNGLNSFGIDIDINAIKFAYHKLKIDSLFIAESGALPFNKDTFEAVILNHVLEHLPDPVRCLEQIQNVLKENGLLFIIVPYIKGLIPRLRPRSWIGLSIEAHFWHFDRGTISQLLINSGFKIINLKVKSMYTPLIDSKLKRLTYDILSKFGRTFGLGDEILLIAGKAISR